jgi:hypothetical protein
VDVEKNRKENGLKDRWKKKKNAYAIETRPSSCVCVFFLIPKFSNHVWVQLLK